jgi:hypothetical protein
MIVGGYAVAFHGFPRFTKDIDIYFEPTPENINKIIQAMEEFGFSKEELDGALFATKGNIVTFGVAPVRVDFINEIDGVSFLDAKDARVRGKYGNAEVFFISKEHLLKNKMATPRIKDKIDVEELS